MRIYTIETIKRSGADTDSPHRYLTVTHIDGCGL